jgi:hypothetical protein
MTGRAAPATALARAARELEPLVDAQTLAGYLGVGVAWVYEHAVELGARRLGSGPKARLSFRSSRSTRG